MNITIKNHVIHVDGQPVTYDQTPNGGRPLNPRGQIVHHTSSGLSPDGDRSWLTNPQARASAHAIIAYDGSIIQLQKLNKTTWHAGKSRWLGRSNINNDAIGWEIDNPGQLTKRADGRFDGIGGPYNAKDVVEATSPAHGNARYWLKFSDAQLRTIFGLALATKEAYGLQYLATHWQISPGRKVDPGPHFPLEKLQSVLAGRSDSEPQPINRPTIMDRIAAVLLPPKKPFKTTDDIDGYVNVRSRLNMRRWPHSPQIIARLPNQTPIQIVRSGIYDGSQWHLAKTETGKEGWVHADYIRLID